MKKEKCPNYGSTRLYNEISIVAKKSVNTGKVYDINKNLQDNFFQPTYCEKCGWSDTKGFGESASIGL